MILVVLVVSIIAFCFAVVLLYGIKAIAKILNAEGIKSQGFYQQKLLGKKLGDNKPEIARRFLWENTGVKRLLQNEFYCGTLVCHRSYTSKINHIRKNLPKEEQYRHEDAVPAIISREKWEQAQFLLCDNVERNVRAGQNAPHHRYTGLIKCGDCGSSFVCRKRVWKDSVRYEYTCNAYHRYGKENCSSHRVDEAQLDKLIYDELLEMKEGAEANYCRPMQMIVLFICLYLLLSEKVTELHLTFLYAYSILHVLIYVKSFIYMVAMLKMNYRRRKRDVHQL